MESSGSGTASAEYFASSAASSAVRSRKKLIVSRWPKTSSPRIFSSASLSAGKLSRMVWRNRIRSSSEVYSLISMKSLTRLATEACSEDNGCWAFIAGLARDESRQMAVKPQAQERDGAVGPQAESSAIAEAPLHRGDFGRILWHAN